MATSSALFENSDILEVDRISTLPNDVRIHILSFLPTPCSMSTSFVSRDWRDLWKFVPTLIIHCSCEVKVIRHFHSVRSIFLHNMTDSNCFKSWIEAANQRQVRELDISSLCKPIPTGPLSILCSCQTLEVLKLCGNIYTREATVFAFHHLKVLHLRNMNLATMLRIYSGCPILEELVLDFELGPKDKEGYKILVPTLKRLSIRCRKPVRRSIRSMCYEFEIGCPALESLRIVGPSLLYNMVNLPFRKATVDGESSYYFKRSTLFLELLNARANSESPYLSAWLQMTDIMTLYLTGTQEIRTSTETTI